MRLGLIRFKYDQAGGAEKSLLLLAKGLLDRGHEVHVMTTSWTGHRPPGLNVHYAFVDKSTPSSQAVDFGVAARVQMELLGLDTFLSLDRVPGSPLLRAGDGCHAAWLEHRSPYESALKRFSFKVLPRHRAILDLERRTFTAPELKVAIANSRLVAEELKKHFGLSDDRVAVIYNGVEKTPYILASQPGKISDKRAELGLGEKEKTILFLGSGFERKGLSFAIRALAKVPQARLLVAGRDRISRYKALAARQGVQERVEFLGGRADAPELLALADVMCLPTLYDPCANACLEALACGTPVVTTGKNGASELVVDGKSGFVLKNPADIEDLGLAVSRAMEFKGRFEPDLPSLEDMVGRTAELMEKAASMAGGQGS
ncbi:glycosyltransferase family 4 protein [Dethiosulfatarculus sandiegensis]|uniref:Glycosyl transferase family 1 n=1 Tax=Dethiosulfatarculus sandiegensis TaxID=1429043 RepID=A0A0D2JAY7_9BACT|nr:glycosyltransferase family 4 protein [Dethiosulfatarculus sandiegensis]KIX12886.1 glycosyl transferase family 1 [Dethiosulfatarculus sandiegensis]